MLFRWKMYRRSIIIQPYWGFHDLTGSQVTYRDPEKWSTTEESHPEDSASGVRQWDQRKKPFQESWMMQNYINITQTTFRYWESIEPDSHLVESSLRFQLIFFYWARFYLMLKRELKQVNNIRCHPCSFTECGNNWVPGVILWCGCVCVCVCITVCLIK